MPQSVCNDRQSGSNNRLSRIAWQGWSMSVPHDWRPLKIEGKYNRGSIMIGDASSPVIQIKWQRLISNKSFDAATWLNRRFKSLGALPDEDPPQPEGFIHAAWIRNLAHKNGADMTIWYGYNAKAEILIEASVTGDVTAHIHKKAIGQAIPSLRANASDDETAWALYDVSFAVPPGFVLKRQHLYSGDIALEFIRGKDEETLMVRQVYPGGLALKRRTLERWMEAYPFKEHRFFNLESLSDWTQPDCPARTGLKRKGWKRLRWPLGLCAPRLSSTVIAMDDNLDRILIAEHLCRKNQRRELADQAVKKMNIR